VIARPAIIHGALANLGEAMAITDKRTVRDAEGNDIIPRAGANTAVQFRYASTSIPANWPNEVTIRPREGGRWIQRTATQSAANFTNRTHSGDALVNSRA
jgi:hypothetical protein